MSNLSSSELGKGNVDLPPKTDMLQSNKWKVNYHLQDDELFEHVFELIEKELVPLCKKDRYVFGEEYGSEGNTRHIEGAFILDNNKRMRRTALLKIIKWNYCKPMKGKWDDQKYNIKEGNRILGEYKFKEKKPLKKLACEGNLKDWQKMIITELESEPDDRSIYWIRGNVGMGKTTFCKYIHRTFPWCCITGGTHNDMKNSIVEFMEKNEDYCPEICILNIPKSKDKNYVSYIGIEHVKDMFFYSGKYHGGMVDGNNPHVMIFSNNFPNWDEVDPKRWRCWDIDMGQWVDENTVLANPDLFNSDSE